MKWAYVILIPMALRLLVFHHDSLTSYFKPKPRGFWDCLWDAISTIFPSKKQKRFSDFLWDSVSIFTFFKKPKGFWHYIWEAISTLNSFKKQRGFSDYLHETISKLLPHKSSPEDAWKLILDQESTSIPTWLNSEHILISMITTYFVLSAAYIIHNNWDMIRHKLQQFSNWMRTTDSCGNNMTYLSKDTRSRIVEVDPREVDLVDFSFEPKKEVATGSSASPGIPQCNKIGKMEESSMRFLKIMKSSLIVEHKSPPKKNEVVTGSSASPGILQCNKIGKMEESYKGFLKTMKSSSLVEYKSPPEDVCIFHLHQQTTSIPTRLCSELVLLNMISNCFAAAYVIQNNVDMTRHNLEQLSKTTQTIDSCDDSRNDNNIAFVKEDGHSDINSTMQHPPCFHNEEVFMTRRNLEQLSKATQTSDSCDDSRNDNIEFVKEDVHSDISSTCSSTMQHPPCFYNEEVFMTRHNLEQLSKMSHTIDSCDDAENDHKIVLMKEDGHSDINSTCSSSMQHPPCFHNEEVFMEQTEPRWNNTVTSEDESIGSAVQEITQSESSNSPQLPSSCSSTTEIHYGDEVITLRKSEKTESCLEDSPSVEQKLPQLHHPHAVERLIKAFDKLEERQQKRRTEGSWNAVYLKKKSNKTLCFNEGPRSSCISGLCMGPNSQLTKPQPLMQQREERFSNTTYPSRAVQPQNLEVSKTTKWSDLRKHHWTKKCFEDTDYLRDPKCMDLTAQSPVKEKHSSQVTQLSVIQHPQSTTHPEAMKSSEAKLSSRKSKNGAEKEKSRAPGHTKATKHAVVSKHFTGTEPVYHSSNALTTEEILAPVLLQPKKRSKIRKYFETTEGFRETQRHRDSECSQNRDHSQAPVPLQMKQSMGNLKHSETTESFIEMHPPQKTTPREAKQSLKAEAHFANGYSKETDYSRTNDQGSDEKHHTASKHARVRDPAQKCKIISQTAKMSRAAVVSQAKKHRARTTKHSETTEYSKNM